MRLHTLPEPAPVRTQPRQVALLLDQYLSADAVRHVIELCRNSGGTAVLLAPPPHGAAVSRLEPHLVALTQAAVEWEIAALDHDSPYPVRDFLRRRSDIAVLVCDARSEEARAGDVEFARPVGTRPVALHVLLSPLRGSIRPQSDSVERLTLAGAAIPSGFLISGPGR